MRGRLYRVRRYPGMRPARDADDVVWGELYRLHHPAKTFHILDAYEGEHEYRRELRLATRESGRPVPVWAYVYRFALPAHRRLAGEWK